MQNCCQVMGRVSRVNLDSNEVKSRLFCHKSGQDILNFMIFHQIVQIAEINSFKEKDGAIQTYMCLGLTYNSDGFRGSQRNRRWPPLDCFPALLHQTYNFSLELCSAISLRFPVQLWLLLSCNPIKLLRLKEYVEA